MLRHHRLPTKRTLRLLPDPIPNARPAKHMSARRHARIAHRLQAQRAFPLLRTLHPGHHPRLFEIVARMLGIQDGGVRCFLDAVLGVVGCRCRLQEEIVITRVVAATGADLHTAVYDRAVAWG